MTSVLGTCSLDCEPYTQKLGSARKSGEGLRARQEERVHQGISEVCSFPSGEVRSARFAVQALLLTSRTRGVASRGVCADLPRSAIPAAPIAEWIDELRQLPQIRRAGRSEVPGVSHAKFPDRLSTHRGLHATYNIPAGSSQECARCHSEHNGEDFPLIKWDIKTFDHKEAGYMLEGKHAGLTCNKCHNPSHISAQNALPSREGSEPDISWPFYRLRHLPRGSAQRATRADMPVMPQFRRLEDRSA